jgi:hypothetical protein
VAGEELVEGVEERPCPQGSQGPAERARQAELGEDLDCAPVVARDRCAVAEHEPPALAAPLLRNGCEQAAGLLVSEWEQC